MQIYKGNFVNILNQETYFQICLDWTKNLYIIATCSIITLTLYIIHIIYKIHIYIIYKIHITLYIDFILYVIKNECITYYIMTKLKTKLVAIF